MVRYTLAYGLSLSVFRVTLVGVKLSYYRMLNPHKKSTLAPQRRWGRIITGAPIIASLL